MSKEIHYCEVCGISSQIKRVNFVLRFLCEKYILKEYRNTSNDELYKSYIDKLTDSQKENIIKYFKEKLNTSKDGV